MPLKKGSSVSLPTERIDEDQHPLKRKQPLSFDDHKIPPVEANKLCEGLIRNRLIRSNDLLTSTSTEVLLDLLKGFSGVKECSDETQTHLYMVSFRFDKGVKTTGHVFDTLRTKIFVVFKTVSLIFSFSKNIDISLIVPLRYFWNFTLGSKERRVVRVEQLLGHCMAWLNALHRKYSLPSHVLF